MQFPSIMNGTLLTHTAPREEALAPQALSGSQVFDACKTLFGPGARRVFLPLLLASLCGGAAFAHTLAFAPARHSVRMVANSEPASAEELRAFFPDDNMTRTAASMRHVTGEGRSMILLPTAASLPGGAVSKLPVYPASSGPGTPRSSGIASVYSYLAEATTGPKTGSAAETEQAQGFLSLDDGTVTIHTADGGVVVERLREAASTLAFALSASDADLSPAFEDDVVPFALYDLPGGDYPAIWNWSAEDFASAVALECALEHNARGLTRFIGDIDLPLLPGDELRARKYRPLVQQYADKYKLTPAMIMAVMHTESNFNPLAVSRNNALGLMQIVPESAGHEVHTYLTGLPGEPPVDVLFSPDQNIRYGATYLHLLARRHFNKVLDPASREMCVIAAYNGGPNAVLRVFDDDAETAFARINTLTPDQVYDTLVTRAPSAETRRYVSLVLGHMRTYSQF